MKDATACELKYDDKKESILWAIIGEVEYISNDDYFHTLKSNSTLTIDISINYDDPFADNFVNYMWLDLTGSGNIIDKYHQSLLSDYYSTVQSCRIKFYDPEAIDSDHLVKQCILCMIASLTLDSMLTNMQ